MLVALEKRIKYRVASALVHFAWLIAQGVINSVFCRLTVFGPLFVLFLNELGLSKSRTGAALSLTGCSAR